MGNGDFGMGNSEFGMMRFSIPKGCSFGNTGYSPFAKSRRDVPLVALLSSIVTTIKIWGL